MITDELASRAATLTADRAPFVVATVVRAQKPTSVRPGDSAIVLADGTIEGFVGGACAEQSVRLHALRALETHEGMLLRILPDDAPDSAAAEGAVNVSNPCLSGGALEIFLEPRVPAPRVAIVGDTPIAGALARLAPSLDLEVGGAVAEGDLAAVVASHGRDELETLRLALDAHIPYIGLVASRARGKAVVEELGAPDGAIETPAGLDIGARTPEEVALSILARIVSVRRSAAHGPEPVATAVDPVCGMEVAVTAETPRSGDVYFCCETCRESYVGG